MRLRALIHELNQDWDELLPAVLFAMRTSVNRTTGYTPFFLSHGREARLPIDLVYGSIPTEAKTIDEYVKRLHSTFYTAFQVVSQKQNDYILRQRSLYQEKARAIQIDDLVWLFTKRPNPGLNRKFQSFYSGPYRVMKQVSNTIFDIQSYGKWCTETINTTAAVDRLKKCTIRDPETNEGIPIDLKASDVAPYFEEGEEALGKIPASHFSPHLFDESSPLPFVDQPLPVSEPTIDHDPILPPVDPPPVNLPLPIPVEEEENAPVDNNPLPEEPVSPLPPTDEPPPVPPHARRRVTIQLPETREPTEERRRPGRPMGARNKTWPCPRCVVDGPKCTIHCQACRTRQPCAQHSDSDRCAQCTRTRKCPRHLRE